MKIFRCFLLIIISGWSCTAPQVKIKLVKTLSSYPSGSAIEIYDHKIYIAGDDAPTVWVGNENLQQVDSIRISASPYLRIPKSLKHDVESVTKIGQGDSSCLLFISSGSLDPYRLNAYTINLKTKSIDSFPLRKFYKQLKNRGNIAELNIEGAACINDKIWLANRGNKSYPKNHFIVCDANFYKDSLRHNFHLIKAGFSTDTSTFSGISGLAYSGRFDRLFMTVSSEDTYTSNADGTIGKSYIWIVDQASTKAGFAAINPNKVIDLNAADGRFSGHKIESVCVRSESKNSANLLLVSDDDNGETTVIDIELTGL